MHPFERYVLIRHVAALASGGGEVWARWWRTTELSQWILRHHCVLGMPALADAKDELDPSNNAIMRDAAFRHFTSLRQAKAPQPSSCERKLSWLSEEVGLGTLDRSVLCLLARIGTILEFHTLALALASQFIPERLLIPHNNDVSLRSIAALLGLSPSCVGRRLVSQKPLRMYGLADDRRGQDYAASEMTMKVVSAHRSAPDALRNILFGTPKSTSLKWEDFAHLHQDAETLTALLQAATQSKASGINILLYGVPGTGKTAFASALAARLGLHAIFVGETTNAGEEPEREERISALALAQKLSSRSDRLLLVVDEAEDIFIGVDDSRGSDRRGAKVFINNLVESNPCPTIFISNHPHRLGAAILRRMTYAMEFPPLHRAARERIVRRIAARHRITLDEDGVRSLSRLDAPPALIDHGLRAARLCKAGTDVALRATASVLKVMGGRRKVQEGARAEFHPSFACADADLVRLSERVMASGRTDISLCLSGLPGTGKSAYARHLAGQMGLEVLEKRASDLFGMFVGETEENIAACFREAEERRAFLIFDEADSLLRDRIGAGQSYEVRQVNEMLTWMEHHPYPFACTTNFLDGLDPAASRRFLFKVKFLPLAPEPARALFLHTFGLSAPASLDGLTCLTPGDFAVVARKALVMGEKDPLALVDALAAEVESKPGGTSRPIGFRACATRA